MTGDGGSPVPGQADGLHRADRTEALALPWRIHDNASLRELLGRPLICPETLLISQERINRFADATDDHQWIHVDPVRAGRESPFGSTIAHGFLSLSMLPWFLERTVLFDRGSMGINYGLDRVRFVRAVRAGTPLTARIVLSGLDEHDWGVHLTWDVAVTETLDPTQASPDPAEGPGKGPDQGDARVDPWARPALAARWLTRWYRGEG